MSSSSSLEKEIDEYQDNTSGSVSSGESSEGSTSYNDSSDEHYSSGVPGISLGEFQELQRRIASKSGTSSSRQPPSLLKTRKRMRKMSFIAVPQR